MESYGGALPFYRLKFYGAMLSASVPIGLGQCPSAQSLHVDPPPLWSGVDGWVGHLSLSIPSPSIHPFRNC